MPFTAHTGKLALARRAGLAGARTNRQTGFENMKRAREVMERNRTVARIARLEAQLALDYARLQNDTYAK